MDWEQELEVVEKYYQDYKNKFIKKTGSAEIPFWQIVADKLKALH